MVIQETEYSEIIEFDCHSVDYAVLAEDTKIILAAGVKTRRKILQSVTCVRIIAIYVEMMFIDNFYKASNPSTSNFV